MGKQYSLTKEDSQDQMIKDETSFAYTSQGQIIAPQILDPSDLITDMPPYTMEELNSRIDEAEKQIDCGDVFSHEEVMAEMKTLIASWS